VLHKLRHTESFTKYAMSSAYLWCSFEEPISLQKFLSAQNPRGRRARTCWQMWPVHIPLSVHYLYVMSCLRAGVCLVDWCRVCITVNKGSGEYSAPLTIQINCLINVAFINVCCWRIWKNSRLPVFVVLWRHFHRGYVGTTRYPGQIVRPFNIIMCFENYRR
jgi:hypothetical protein